MLAPLKLQDESALASAGGTMACVTLRSTFSIGAAKLSGAQWTYFEGNGCYTETM